MMFLLYFFTALFAMFAGVTHQILYSMRGSFWAKWNEHIIWVCAAIPLNLDGGVYKKM